jgi:hypothetical protein
MNGDALLKLSANTRLCACSTRSARRALLQVLHPIPLHSPQTKANLYTFLLSWTACNLLAERVKPSIPTMNINQFANEIRKTGFVLENRIAQDLKTMGWTVISNKYYVDDLEESVREIDLIAYRVTKVQHFDVYTSLIISCKKSDANAWALLAREINLKDPNSDWWPLHVWSNDKALNFQLGEDGKAKKYHIDVASLGVTEALSDPSVEVFAFQEMDKSSGRPQNDKPIFSAVTSLIKAQAYELGILPARKKTPCVYQFNLLSVVDTDLVRLIFKGSDIDSIPLETEHYLTRYIVRKRETFSRIRFIKASAFTTALQDYGRLHQANSKWFSSECDAFYLDLNKNSNKNDLLVEEFKTKLHNKLLLPLYKKFLRIIDLSAVSVNWSESRNCVWIGFLGEDDVLTYLNSDPIVKNIASKVLSEIYRYEGNFYFEDDIPF